MLKQISENIRDFCVCRRLAAAKKIKMKKMKNQFYYRRTGSIKK